MPEKIVQTAGWPKSWAVFRLAKDVWNEEPADTEEEAGEETGEGSGSVKNMEQYEIVFLRTKLVGIYSDADSVLFGRV